MLRLYKAFFYSMQGLRWGFLREPALRQEMLALLVGTPLALWLAPDAGWLLALVGGLLLLLAVELLNTAIEKLADFVTADRHEAIGAVKDMGSAAVFCLLVLNAGLWGWAAWAKLAG